MKAVRAALLLVPLSLNAQQPDAKGWGTTTWGMSLRTVRKMFPTAKVETGDEGEYMITDGEFHCQVIFQD